MSGGISAIKGFDYQATVILDRLFDHLDRHGPMAQVRPEGLDDLDLLWTEDGAEHRRYEQIKKPTEDRDGNLNPTPWTLSAVIDELLPNTIAHLSGNSDTQIWIVGDEVDGAVASLISAGNDAPITAAKSYWAAVHNLARKEVLGATKLEQSIRAKLHRWRVPDDLPADPAKVIISIVTEFGAFAEKAGAGPDIGVRYGVIAKQLHDCLPSVLVRTSILSAYGTEQEIVQRVYVRLEQRYALDRSTVENTLFRNLAASSTTFPSSQDGDSVGRNWNSNCAAFGHG